MRLSERAMLVNLTIAVWHAEREDKTRADEVARKYGADPKMGKYRRFLIDPDALKPITKGRSEMRNRHYELTLPWGDDSSRIITTAGFFRYRDEMQAFQRNLEGLFQDFINDYPAHVANAATLLNGLHRPEEYPSVDRIKGMFRVGYRVRPVPDAGDFRANIGQDEVDTIRQQIKAEEQQLVNDAMGDATVRIKQVIGHLATSLREYTVSDKGVRNPFRDSLVGNVRKLVDILPGLNVAGNKGIDALIADMQRDLTQWDADTLRTNDTQREQVAKSAESILSRMAEYGL